MRVYESTADTAKKIRLALKEAFPDLPSRHFSVSSSTYSGGSSVSVNFEDYPSYGEVKDVVSKFSSASFDGSIDLETHTGYSDMGLEFSGANYITVNRQTTDTRSQAIEAIYNNMLRLNLISDDPNMYAEQTKIDNALNRDLFYLGDRKHIEGITGSVIANLADTSPLRKEDFAQKIPDIISDLTEEHYLNNRDTPAPSSVIVESVDYIGSMQKEIQKIADDEISQMVLEGEEVTRDKRTTQLLKFKQTVKDRFHLLNGDLTVTDVIVKDGLIDVTPVKNEIKKAFSKSLAKFRVQGFTLSKPIIKKVTKDIEAISKMEDLKTSQYDLERIGIRQVVSLYQTSIEEELEADIRNGNGKVVLTKQEEQTLDTVMQYKLKRYNWDITNDLQLALSNLLSTKKDTGLKFQNNFGQLVKNEVNRIMAVHVENSLSEDNKNVLAEMESEKTIENIIKTVADRGYKFNGAEFEIKLADNVMYLSGSANNFTKEKLTMNVFNAVESVISTGNFTSDEQAYVNRVVENLTAPHLASLEYNNSLDFFRKTIKQALLEIAENKPKQFIRLSDQEYKTRIESYLLDGVNELVTQEIRYSLRYGSEEYESNLNQMTPSYVDRMVYVEDSYSNFYELVKQVEDGKGLTSYYEKESVKAKALISDIAQRYTTDQIQLEEYNSMINQVMTNLQSVYEGTTSETKEKIEQEKALEEGNRSRISSLIKAKASEGFVFTSSGMEDTVLEQLRPYAQENILTPEDILDVLERQRYNRVLTTAELETIVNLLHKVLTSRKDGSFEKLSVQADVAKFYTEIVEGNMEEITSRKFISKNLIENKKTMSEYVLQVIPEILDNKLIAYDINVENSIPKEISDILTEELTRFGKNFTTITGEEGEFFNDKNNFPITLEIVKGYTESGKGTPISIRKGIIKGIRQDTTAQEGYINYRIKREELEDLHNKLKMDSYTHIVSDEYFAKVVQALYNQRIPMTELFTFLNENSSNAGYYLDKLVTIGTTTNWLQQTNLYKNLLKQAKRYIREDPSEEKDKELLADYIKSATESLVKATRERVIGSKYLKDKDIVTVLVNSFKDEYSKFIIQFGKKVESYNEDMKTEDKALSLNTNRLITEVADFELDLSEKVARILRGELNTNLSPAKKSAILRESTIQFENKIVDYAKDRLKMYSINYSGNLTMDNLIKIDSGFQELKEEYLAEDLNNLSTEELDLVFEGYKEPIVKLLNKMLVKMTEENTQVAEFGLLVSKNGLSVKEKSNAVRITRSLFNQNTEGTEDYPTEMTIDSKLYAVSLKHYILGIKEFNADLGRYLIKSFVTDQNLYEISTENIEEGSLVNNSSVITQILKVIAEEFEGEGQLNDRVTEKLPFNLIPDNLLTSSDVQKTIFEEALKNTLEKLSDKKGIVFAEEHIKTKYKEELIELEVYLGKSLAKVSKVTKGIYANLVSKTESILTNFLADVQKNDNTDYTLTFTDREMVEIRTRLSGRLSRYKGVEKLTKTFREKVVAEWLNGTIPVQYTPKKVDETFSTNLENLRTDSAIKVIIDYMIDKEKTNGEIVHTNDVSPTSGKAVIDGMSERKLANHFSESIMNVTREGGEAVTNGDRQVLFTKLYVRNNVVELCDRVNARLFNHRVHRDENVDVDSITRQELQVTEDAFKETDFYKQLMAEIGTDSVIAEQNDVFNGINMRNLLIDLNSNNMQVAHKNTNGNVWSTYKLVQGVIRTGSDLNEILNSGVFKVKEVPTGKETYLLINDILGYKSLEGEIITADNVNIEDLGELNMYITTENIISRLDQSVLRVVFQKIGNGERRVMFATRNSDLIAHYAQENNLNLTDSTGNKDKRFDDFSANRVSRQIEKDYITVFSLDSNDFRTIKPSSLYSFDSVDNVPSIIQMGADYNTWKLVMDKSIFVSDLNIDDNYVADEVGEFVDLSIKESEDVEEIVEEVPEKVVAEFIPSANDVTYKNINVTELIHLLQNNTVTVKFRKKPTKKIPDGEIRVLKGTRNLELIKESIKELDKEKQDIIISNIKTMNTKEYVAGELSKGTIGMFEYEINEGRQFTLARLLSYQVEGSEEVVLEEVVQEVVKGNHFDPKSPETFVTAEDMYNTLRNKVVRVTFEKADKNERVMYCTMNSDLMENYYVRDLEKIKVNPEAEIKTSEENKAEQLETGLFKVLDLEAQSFRSFKFDKVLSFNDLHKVSSWIEFEPLQMGWFDALKGNANIADLEDVGNRNAKETTTDRTAQRIELETNNNHNYKQATRIIEMLNKDIEEKSSKMQKLKDRYAKSYERFEYALEKVAEVEELIKSESNVMKYTKKDLEIKVEQEKLLAEFSVRLGSMGKDQNYKLNAYIKPKSNKDMTTTMVVEYSVVANGLVEEGFEAVIVNPRFLLNGVSYQVVEDTTNSLHFGTGSVMKSPINSMITKVMEKISVNMFGTPQVQISQLADKMIPSDSKRLQRLLPIINETKEAMKKAKLQLTLHNPTPEFPAHLKVATTENGKKVVWQITPAYIYDETNGNLLYTRQNTGSTSKELETYLLSVLNLINSKNNKEKLAEFGITISDALKIASIHAITSKAFNLRTAVK